MTEARERAKRLEVQVRQQQERILERDAQLQRLQADLSELQLEQHAHQQSAVNIASLQVHVRYTLGTQ